MIQMKAQDSHSPSKVEIKLDGLASFMSKCNSSWIVGMDLGSKDNSTICLIYSKRIITDSYADKNIYAALIKETIL